ncbi:MAG: glycosyltransferase [Cyclobacteriaceae bacterium]|nr:glycosyltransferase [Cyclobacteriaceae bacterium]
MNILCFSHLRWNFVYQRPQHLMSRFAKTGTVYFIEEPVFDAPWTFLNASKAANADVTILVPHVQAGIDVNDQLRSMLEDFLKATNVNEYVAWYYSPMALPFTDTLSPSIIVYDCMDELAGFKFAPPDIKEREAQLFKMADVVFTGGYTLFEAKKNCHDYIFPFPSSIDKDHFLQARAKQTEPEDQQNIPHPRLGFYGVLDERLDLQLIAEIARLRPEWHIVLIGPVIKIDADTLPQAQNIHYLGGKEYTELPLYLSGWDIAIMPFALNESTKYISPTKTPEYLSGGKPVISTPISDVVNDYGSSGLVSIAETAEQFVIKAELLLASTNTEEWLSDVDQHMLHMSWDNTWQHMSSHMENAIAKKQVFNP